MNASCFAELIGGSIARVPSFVRDDKLPRVCYWHINDGLIITYWVIAWYLKIVSIRYYILPLNSIFIRLVSCVLRTGNYIASRMHPTYIMRKRQIYSREYSRVYTPWIHENVWFCSFEVLQIKQSLRAKELISHLSLHHKRDSVTFICTRTSYNPYIILCCRRNCILLEKRNPTFLILIQYFFAWIYINY